MGGERIRRIFVYIVLVIIGNMILLDIRKIGKCGLFLGSYILVINLYYGKESFNFVWLVGYCCYRIEVLEERFY